MLISGYKQTSTIVTPTSNNIDFSNNADALTQLNWRELSQTSSGSALQLWKRITDKRTTDRDSMHPRTDTTNANF